MEELFRFYPERGLYQPIVQWGLFVFGIACIIFSTVITFSKRARNAYIKFVSRVIFKDPQ